MKWEDVGGLEEVKRSILDTVQVGLFFCSPFLSLSLSPVSLFSIRCNLNDLSISLSLSSCLCFTRNFFHLGSASALVFFFMVLLEQGRYV